MLLLASNTITVDGVTVFPDHADPQQFWYLPAPVGLAKLPGSDEPQFLLMMYAPDVAGAGIKGAGFLNFTTALVLTDDARQDIIGQIRAQFPSASDPRLEPVNFDDGTVQVVALGTQGGGGTTGAPVANGAFEAVEKILGAVSPNLFGNNEAAFSLTLSEEGASILEAAFEDGMAPVGVIYSLKFTGVRPAIDVKITADLKRAYDAFSVGLTAQVYWVSAGIDATFEKLRQDGVIKVEVVNLTTDQENRDKEQWALSLFKDQLLAEWFKPSLAPPSGGASVGAPQLPPAHGAAPSPASPPSGGTMPKPSTSITGTSGGMTSVKPAGSGGMAGSGAPSMTNVKPAVPATSAAPAGGGTVSAPPAATGKPGATDGVKPPPVPAGAGGAAGAVANAANALAGAATAASSAASPFGVALRLKYVQQDELKTLTVEYNRMDAVQRTYAPQGYFGLMLSQIDKSKHFLKVDGTDPFFRKFAVTINPPPDFAGIGLLTAHVAIDYGDPDGPTDVKHGEFMFDAANATRQVWQVFEGLIPDTSYRYTVDYRFNPESGWQGEQGYYLLPTMTTENREITLDPHDLLGFLQIAVSPGEIDAEAVDRIEVTLSYTAKSGWSTSTMMTVRAGSAPQFWRLRLADKNDRTYSWRSTCFLKDGSTFKTGPVDSVASALVVSDPFMGALNLVFQPALDPTKTKLAAVELDYQDDAHQYAYSTSFEMTSDASKPTKLHIPLIDPTKTEYRYRTVLVGTRDQQTSGVYVTAKDSFVVVSDAAS